MGAKSTSTKTFKIRDKGTGLFSTGGMSPRWSKKGKAWSGTGPLNLHLAQFSTSRIYANAEVVTFELVEAETRPMAEVFAEVEARRDKREQDRKDRARRWQEEQEKAQLRALQQKYPNV